MSDRPMPSQRRPDRAALLIPVVLIALAAVIVWDMGRLTGAGGYDRIGPTTVPFIVAGGLVVMAIGLAISAWRGSFPARERQEWGPVLWIVAALAAQIVLLPFAGFSIAAGALFALAARGFGQRNFFISVPAGFILAFALWFAFGRLLQLTLPTGALERMGAQGVDAVVQGLWALLQPIFGSGF
jgi:putative tricarboxylic transport membrane protein